MDDTNWEEYNINGESEKIHSKKINDIEIEIKKDFGGVWKVSFDRISSDHEPVVKKYFKIHFLQKGLRNDDDIIKYLKVESVKNLKKIFHE